MSSARENCNAALTFRREGKPDAAVAHALKALTEDPSLAEAWECAALVYMQHFQWMTARDLLARAIEFVPRHPALETAYALALAETGALKEAAARIDDVLRRAPDHAPAIFAKAEILSGAGYYDLALPLYAEAEKHQMIRKSAGFALAAARFMTGDFTGGLPGLSLPENDARDAPPLPLWYGQPEKHVVLYGSQGFGDIIMLLRYVKKAQAAAKKITLRVPYQLVQLVHDSFPGLPIVVSKDPGDSNEINLPSGIGFDLPADAEARCPLIRLAWMFGGFDPRAEDVPYLRGSSAKAAVWQARFASLPQPRIGLVWSGSPRNVINHQRSMPFEMLEPVISLAKGHLVSLQMGPEKARAEPAGIFDASEFIRDFADSAALVSALDLIITVDSSPAHLAGALGKPVWNLMPFRPTDWRWLLGRENTLWYPTMRLFRQTQPGGWSGVMENVCAGLRRFLEGDQSVLRPTPWEGDILRRHPHAVELE